MCIYKVGNFIGYSVQLLSESCCNFSITGSSAAAEGSSGHTHSAKCYTSESFLGPPEPGSCETKLYFHGASLFMACFGSNSKLGTQTVFKTTCTLETTNDVDLVVYGGKDKSCRQEGLVISVEVICLASTVQ